jgi:heme/copper-type cytochrome/quinol oxidase subunit 3
MEHGERAISIDDPSHPLYARTGSGLYNKKLGMWVFLGSEIMFFTGLIASYLVLRMSAPFWPAPSTILNVDITAMNTLVLIFSSFTMSKALESAARTGRRSARLWLFVTLMLGGAFLGIQLHEYSVLIAKGIVVKSSMFASTFYLLTGFHGLHVAAGLLCIAFQTVRGFMGGLDVGDYSGIEVLGLYWHFVDLVWLVLFATLYLF